MARNGAPPMPVNGRQCKVPYCHERSIEKALFCAIHEMKWIGLAAVPSYGLKSKHGRRYRRFLKREGDLIVPPRSDIYAEFFRQSWRLYGKQA